MLLTIIIAILLGSILSIVLSGSLLLLNNKRLDKISNALVSLAGGTLLGAAFLGMMPKAVSLLPGQKVFMIVLAGIIVFFIIEKLILWHTCHNKNCERHQGATAPLILIGDAFHNFIDGVVIAAAFSASEAFGIAVTFSVFAHEIPQEVADFGILIRSGYSRRKAMLMNLLSGLSALPAGILAYYALQTAQNLIPWFLAFSAASFIYISLADLFPQMHKKTNLLASLQQLLLILSGIGMIVLIKWLK